MVQDGGGPQDPSDTQSKYPQRICIRSVETFLPTFSIYSVKHERGGKEEKGTQWCLLSVDVSCLSSRGKRKESAIGECGAHRKSPTDEASET